MRNMKRFGKRVGENDVGCGERRMTNT